jgi:hypothetical protein
MPGPVSDPYAGPRESDPYVPSWHYPRGAKTCPCGHHEGYHNSMGQCINVRSCGCRGLPPECFTEPRDEGDDE